MSLIVDVLKRAQKDAVSIKPPPPFIEYPYKKDLSLKAIISRYVWLFSGAIGFGIIMLFMVFMITRQGGGSPLPGRLCLNSLRILKNSLRFCLSPHSSRKIRSRAKEKNQGHRT